MPQESSIGLPRVCRVPAAMVRTMVFYPLDLARTRITADTSPPGPHRHYPTIRKCLSSTLKQV